MDENETYNLLSGKADIFRPILLILLRIKISNGVNLVTL